MDDYLNWNNNNNNNNNNNGIDTNKDSSSTIPNIPTSTINDQDLLDFTGLDQFIPNIRNDDNDTTRYTNYLNPSINEEFGDDDDENELNRNLKQNAKEFQPQSYHLPVLVLLLTPSSYNSKPISSSLSGVRRSLSKAMTNSRKNSIIKDDLSNSPYIKSPRSRKSSIVGTPNSIAQLGQTTSVERKRRDNINDKIQELLTIIPDTFFYENEKSTGTKDGKPNKGQILTKSVEYIQFLQNEIDFKNRKEVESIYRLKKLNFDTSNFTNTSAEIGLGKIGVGPLSHLQHEQIKDKWLENGQFETPVSNDNHNNNNNNNNNNNIHNDNDNADFLNF